MRMNDPDGRRLHKGVAWLDESGPVKRGRGGVRWRGEQGHAVGESSALVSLLNDAGEVTFLCPIEACGKGCCGVVEGGVADLVGSERVLL